MRIYEHHRSNGAFTWRNVVRCMENEILCRCAAIIINWHCLRLCLLHSFIYLLNIPWACEAETININCSQSPWRSSSSSPSNMWGSFSKIVGWNAAELPYDLDYTILYASWMHAGVQKRWIFSIFFFIYFYCCCCGCWIFTSLRPPPRAKKKKHCAQEQSAWKMRKAWSYLIYINILRCVSTTHCNGPEAFLA